MSAVFERRPSPAAAWSVRLAWFAAVLFSVGGLAHRYGLLETEPFFWVLGIVGFSAVIAVGCACAGFFDLWDRGDRGGRRAFGGGMLAALVLFPFAISGWRFAEYPKLVDISTDAVDPPALRAAARLRPAATNRIGAISPAQAGQIAEHYPQVNGRRYAVSPDRVLEAATAIVADRGWTVTDMRGVPQQDAEITVEALAFSYLLRFPADIAVRLTDEGASTFVDMRSASRYTAHDLGDNARRIERFLAELDAMMSVQPER